MSNLTLEQLKEQSPELYMHCMKVGIEEGIQKGIQKERARCINHLPKHTNDPLAKLVIENVKSGVPMTNMAKANYMCIQIKANREVQQRAIDSEKVVSFLEYKLGAKHNEYSGGH